MQLQRKNESKQILYLKSQNALIKLIEHVRAGRKTQREVMV